MRHAKRTRPFNCSHAALEWQVARWQVARVRNNRGAHDAPASLWRQHVNHFSLITFNFSFSHLTNSSQDSFLWYLIFGTSVTHDQRKTFYE